MLNTGNYFLNCLSAFALFATGGLPCLCLRYPCFILVLPIIPQINFTLTIKFQRMTFQILDGHSVNYGIITWGAGSKTIVGSYIS